MQNNPNYHNNVSLKYQLYNSLFLLLPFEGVNRTGTLLPLFNAKCSQGLTNGLTADEIINQFFKEYVPTINDKNKFDYLFEFIKYVERQVVLFDSVEDSSYELIKNVQGKGSLKELDIKVQATDTRKSFRELLDEVSVRIVLTAHPTQFYTGEVLGIIADLEPAIKSNKISEVDNLLRQLGKTPFLKKVKPTPFEEAVSLIWFLENVFYKTLPTLFKSCAEIAGISAQEIKNANLFSIGFWPGGDRDGNPFVSPETTVQVAERLRVTLLKCYYRDLRVMRRRLTFSGIVELVVNAEQKIYSGAFSDGKFCYFSSTEFINDLQNIRSILIEKHQGLFLELVDDLILKVNIFGFHFAKMDVRQNMKKHRLAYQQLLGEWSENDAGYLNKVLHFNSYELNDDSPEAIDFIATLEAIKLVQLKNGEEACNRYIISNSTSAVDVIEVFKLAKCIFNSDENLPLDVIPLFESVEDLKNAANVIEELFNIPEYSQHLSSRSRKQTIMLGFSDGTKDGGYLKANWSIFKAKEALTSIGEKYNIKIVFFDGRGGPPGRGGGNTHEFYSSQGSTVSSKEIQVTIQGQTINSNYGKVVTCKHNLEQLFSAIIENQLFPKTINQFGNHDRLLMEELCDEAYSEYLKLKNHSSFVPYLEKATPLKWFGDANIGSRPAKRNAGGNFVFEDLRAIPFVGSWALMKQNVPGYYGIGSGIQTLIAKGKLSELIQLVNNSPYLKSLLSNSMQSLAKCNFEASSWLKSSLEFKEFYSLLIREFNLSKQNILVVLEHKELMHDVPISMNSVAERERIVLPLVVIQQFALQMLNSIEITEEEKAIFQKLVMRCMFGIINAARNAA